MDFYKIVDQVVALVQQRGQVTYRSLKRQFVLDDDYFEDLKAELLYTHPDVIDDEGRGFKWAGAAPVLSSKPVLPAPVPQAQVSLVEGSQVPSQGADLRPLTSNLSPVSYTPAHLADRIRAEQAVLAARSGTDGERKTITALFADLKGSTALIEGLDPEEAQAIIDPALQVMMDAVHRYEGYVAQALGDGIFALFGAPIAHEDHPQRALYAALRMQEEMRWYADTLRAKGYPPLLMRVGVNTGEVVVRSIRKDDLHTDYVPVGHSTNLAARMEQLAAPGSILVSAYTHKLTDGYFVFKDLGQTQIKGVEEELNIYEVLGAGPLRTRLQVSATRRGLTRFVGRQRELEQMQQALAQAKAGHGQIVGVMGEPGLGKSRLFYEFKLLSQPGCLILESYSVSHGKASPYLPVIELLKSYFDIQVLDDERKKREKVTGKVLTLDRSLEDTLPYLFALLGIEEQPSPLQQMDPQIRRKRTFEALKKLFTRESLNQPLVLIFEDLHWIDSETQGFLDTLSESVASARLLLLTNYRPEYRHEWGQKTYYTQLRLAPFGKAEAEEFLDVLLGIAVGATVRSPLHQLILEKTQGTPFFMEEIVQELRERGLLSDPRRVGTAHLQVLPTTVQGILAARIDRLAPDEKALLQQVSVIGREFPLSLVRHVVPQPEEELYRVLASLQHKEFLYEQPAFPEVEYIFKHALTQEVAYNTVLQEQRKVLHERTAQALETLYATSLDEHYSDFAHHYSRSGNTEKAIEYLQMAGEQAVQRSAYAEAINHLTTALELLKTLPDTPERTKQELTLQVALGVSLGTHKGYAAPEVGNAYTQARELCRQIGETPQLALVLPGLYRFYLLQAEHQTACELAEQTLRLAQSVQDPSLLLEAHKELGFSSYELGEFVPALEHLEQGIALYDSEKHQLLELAFPSGMHPGVMCLSFAARALWYLGYPDQALKRNQEALTFARESSDPFSLSITLYFAAVLHQLRQEVHLTQDHAEAVIVLSMERGFAQFLAQSTIMRGWALSAQGQGEEGISQMHQGLAASYAIGTRQGRPYMLAHLAEAYRKVGQTKEGLTVLAEALAAVNKSGEHRHEAELYRLKGELTLQQDSLQGLESRGNEGEECFHTAIEIAQQQQAKSLELRAATSLARLWQQQGKKTEAHHLLAEIYEWFTEGFDTKDLQEAKGLLEELT